MTNGDTYWLVRRIRRHDGITLARPNLWGKVLASSATEAVGKFVHALTTGENVSHFDAVPFKAGR